MSRLTTLLTIAAVCLWAGVSSDAQPPIATSPLPFSAARQAGNTLYVSGQLPRTPDGQDVRESIGAETMQAMDNIKRILEQNGYTMDDVVFVNVYLKSVDDYSGMNQAYAQCFGDRFPARACVGGAEVVFGFRVEISCIAYKEQ